MIRITRRVIGDITILDMRGRVTLGVGAQTLGDTVRDLASRGWKKVILNYAEVTYQDSAGNGELVSAFTTVAVHGGSLVLLSPNKRIKDLLQITKIYTALDVFYDEAEALRYLEVLPLHCLCPICGARSSPASIDGATWAPQACGDSKCGARFTLVLPGGISSERIERAQLSTYSDEYFEVIPGFPFRIKVVGRLNLFTSSRLAELWKALPSRIALFDLRLATEISPEGRDALVRLSEPGKPVAAAISLEGLAPECARVFSSDYPVYPDDAAAIAMLKKCVEKLNSNHYYPRFEWPAKFG